MESKRALNAADPSYLEVRNVHDWRTNSSATRSSSTFPASAATIASERSSLPRTRAMASSEESATTFSIGRRGYNARWMSDSVLRPHLTIFRVPRKSSSASRTRDICAASQSASVRNTEYTFHALRGSFRSCVAFPFKKASCSDAHTSRIAETVSFTDTNPSNDSSSNTKSFSEMALTRYPAPSSAARTLSFNHIGLLSEPFYRSVERHPFSRRGWTHQRTWTISAYYVERSATVIICTRADDQVRVKNRACILLVSPLDFTEYISGHFENANSRFSENVTGAGELRSLSR